MLQAAGWLALVLCKRLAACIVCGEVPKKQPLSRCQLWCNGRPTVHPIGAASSDTPSPWFPASVVAAALVEPVGPRCVAIEPRGYPAAVEIHTRQHIEGGDGGIVPRPRTSSVRRIC